MKTSEYHRVFYALCATDLLLRVEWGISTSMLPIYIHELGGSAVEVGMVFGVFAGISVFSNLFWGFASDYLGKRKIFIVSGMALLFPIFLYMAVQREILVLILLRGSTAIFKGAVVPAAWALVSEISTPERVGRHMGLLGSVELAGFALGPAVGGLLTDWLGFGTLWVFVAVICLIGALIFTVLGSDPPTVKKDSRVSFLEAFKKPGLIPKISVLCIAFAIFLLGLTLLGPNLNVYLLDELGYSRSMIGTFSLVGAGSAMLIQPLVGLYSDKYGRKPFLTLAALSLCLGNLVLFWARDLPLILLAQILINNYSIFQSIGSAYIADIVPPTQKSALLGLFSSTGSISRSLGPIIGGYLILLTTFQTLILTSAAFPTLSIILILSQLKESRIYKARVKERS